MTSGRVQLFSNKEPILPSGNYTIDVCQTVAAPEDLEHPIQLNTKKNFTISGPRFRIDPSVDIHSVYPPQGHSEYSNTLAHVVLNSPTAPWDRKLNVEKGDQGGLNKYPWMAVLVFTEDELVLDSAWLTDKGLPAESNTLCIPVTPEKLRTSTAAAIASPFKANPDGTFPMTVNDQDMKESLHVIMLKVEMFKALFGEYSESEDASQTPIWNGKASLERYSYLAHVKKVFTGMDSEATEYSVVVSHRTGPPEVSSPKSIVAHLISLEGLDKIEIGNDHSHVAITSLHAWNWTCIPSNEANFIHALHEMGSNVQPLRAANVKLESLAPGGKTDGLDPARTWLYNQIKQGYTLKKWTLPTGETSTATFRGPLSPILPANTTEQGVKPWSMSGTDLQVLDTKVGIVNLSYNIAWQLGKVLALGDRSFITSLLQLRGNIHSAALQSAKANLDDTHISASDFLGSLKNAVDTTRSANNPHSLIERSMAARWTRVPLQGPTRSEMLTSQHPLVREEYAKQVEQLVLGDADFDPGKALYNDFQSPKNPDWAIVIKWVLDKLFLTDIPHHYLISEPAYIPLESIRTFYIDSVWLEALIDGALSHANHLDREDDVIRRALKENINKYLRHSLNGKQPQIPRWGILMRSSVFHALPDLQITAPWTTDPKDRREVLLTRKIAEDTILCLFGRHPEDGTLSSIIISQPAHQQGFSCGADLNSEKLEMEFRKMANQPGATEEKIGGSLGMRTWRNPSNPDQSQLSEKPVIYDWRNRTLVFPAFAKRCLDELQKTGDFIIEKGKSCPSSVIGAQLTSAAFKLTLNVDSSKEHLDSSNNPGSGHGQLYIPPSEKRHESAPRFISPPSNSRNPDDKVIGFPTKHPSRVVAILPNTIPHREDPRNQEDQLEEYITPWYPDDFHISWWADPRPYGNMSCGCWPLLTTKGSPIPVSTAKGPLDLVFEWRFGGETAGVHFKQEQLEVLFPIADPKFYPDSGAKGAEPALFTLFTPTRGYNKPQEGSVIKSMWPKVRGIGKNSRFLYDTRIVRGYLYEPYNDPKWPWPQYRHMSKPNRLFVVRIRPKTDGEPFGGRGPLDASFVLSGVHTTDIFPGQKVRIATMIKSFPCGGTFIEVQKS